MQLHECLQVCYLNCMIELCIDELVCGVLHDMVWISSIGCNDVRVMHDYKRGVWRELFGGFVENRKIGVMEEWMDWKGSGNIELSNDPTFWVKP